MYRPKTNNHKNSLPDFPHFFSNPVRKLLPMSYLETPYTYLCI